MKLDKALEDNKSPYSAKEYKFICELIWGGAPVERKWAEETSIFKDNAPKILAQYPKLDISFFEQHKNQVKEDLQLDGDVEEIDEVAMFNSEEFKEAFRKQVEADTWDKGLPKVYMNDEGQVVRHWKDGKIEVVAEKKG